MKISAYTAICDEDKEWIPQYLKEVERLEIDFVIHFDKCFFPELVDHPRCVGHTMKKQGEFSEQDKQGMFDLLIEKQYDWGMAWDIDETWETNFKDKIKLLETTDAEYIDCPWANLWEDDEHVRYDGTFTGGHRVKFYRLNRPWRFDSPITNGAKHKGGEEPVSGKLPIVCVHHGMKTKELRQLHKDRWDRIYGHHAGKNPYGFWNYALDESIEPIIIKLQEFYEKHY